jgi:glucose/arabinose dehydrogenase
MMRRRPPATLAVAAMLVATLTACTPAGPEPVPTAVGTPPSATSPSASPDRGAGSNPTALAPLAPTGEPEALITGLQSPWSIVPIATGSIFVSERDSGRIVELTPDGELVVVGTVAGVFAGGEGGLLGLAARDTGAPYLYAYFTSDTDNRIVRMRLTGSPGQYTLGAAEVLLAGIPKARTHNGGRLAFGPDGMLYATTGDAQQTGLAQDISSLAGKIVRLTPEGLVPADNPIAGSYVYSLGHRNSQGLAFDRSGQLWATEFGQNTWDELNRIVAGGNYGWPLAEGSTERSGFIDPEQQWATSDASPSGLGIVDDTLFMTGLRGQRLWSIDVADPGQSRPHFAGELGRIRDAVAAPDGRLLVLTNNTDGRGDPRLGDDHLYAVTLAPRG